MSIPGRPRGAPPQTPAGTSARERQIKLEVTLLGRDYTIGCNESERAELDEAVAMLDRRMREIRDGGKISGAERIAVMAALNFAHDLMRERRGARAPSTDPTQTAAPAFAIDDAGARRRIANMRASIEDVLGGQDKLF